MLDVNLGDMYLTGHKEAGQEREAKSTKTNSPSENNSDAHATT